MRQFLTLCTIATGLFFLSDVQAQAHAKPKVLVVGDSLAVGIRDLLPDALTTRTVRFRAKSGMGTPWGLGQLDAGLATFDADAVLISLGTNDGPDPKRFRSRIAKAMRSAGDRCVVWFTIVRPPRKGPYDALNTELRRAEERYERLHLVHWDAAVYSGRVTLPDNVHPAAAGYRVRARMAADVLRRNCPADSQRIG